MANDHYKGGEVETEEVRSVVASLLAGTGAFMPDEVCRIYDALKYAARAGRKDDWMKDARKCADYLCKAKTGKWLEDFDA